MQNALTTTTKSNPILTTSHTLPVNTKLDYQRHIEENNRFAIQKDLEDTKYSIFKHNTPTTGNATGNATSNSNSTSNESKFDMDKPPFDGLAPTELMKRLNYIYYATANPAKVINYHDFKTHADRYLDKDDTKLSTNDTKLQSYGAGYYPQLTGNQIDAKDCLNDGSGIGSCFQNPQLFYNTKYNFNILSKGVNADNANLIIREDFSMPMNLDPKSRYDPVLFVNAPLGNLDKPLDQQSNESIDLSAERNSQCRNCKLAICKNDICSLQNNLFM